jgi:hypothetical protein
MNAGSQWKASTGGDASAAATWSAATAAAFTATNNFQTVTLPATNSLMLYRAARLNP